MNIIQQLEAEQYAAIAAQRKLPDFEPGDTIRVLVRVTEGQRTRVQAYEGVCIGRSGGGLNESFTVRKISYGEGVERVFPICSPVIEGVEVVRRGRVRRAKLYYLRNLRGKSARIIENTGTRAKKMNDAERKAFAEEKARIEAEKIASAEELAKEKAAEDAAAAKAEAKAAKETAASETAPPQEEPADTAPQEALAEETVSFVDDVVLLDGVGDKTAEAMKAEGITKLTQLVEMDDEALAKFAEAIGAAGKHESQEWKIQAQEMIDGKPPRAKVDQELAMKMANS